MAGIGGSLAVVALCGLCTFLTSISLSAIATNGAMKVEIYYFSAFLVSYCLNLHWLLQDIPEMQCLHDTQSHV